MYVMAHLAILRSMHAQCSSLKLAILCCWVQFHWWLHADFWPCSRYSMSLLATHVVYPDITDTCADVWLW